MMFILLGKKQMDLRFCLLVGNFLWRLFLPYFIILLDDGFGYFCLAFLFDMMQIYYLEDNHWANAGP